MRQPSPRRSAARLAWALVGLTVAAIVVNAALWAVFGAAAVARPWAVTESLLGWPMVLAFAAVGGLVASRRPGNAYGWLLLAIGVLWPVSGLLLDYAALAVTRGLPGADLAVLLGWPGEALPWGLFVTFGLLWFPTGSVPSRRWLSIAWAAALGNLGMVAGLAMSAVELGAEGALAVFAAGSEIAQAGAAEAVNNGGHLLIFASMLAGVSSLFARARSGSAVERQQVKWFAYGAVLVVFSILGLGWAPVGSLAGYVEILALTAMPVVIGIAILRHGLYDIDRVVSRTVAWAVLTGLLVVLYLAMVTLLQRLLAPLTGDSDLAVAGSTLAVAALFTPLRQRVQAAVDRRFDRAHYDAERIVAAFRDRLRDEVDLDDLRRD
ncbi:MAG: hypothetical protein ACR2MA_10560, partial [Egibacteraceae bacterium]